MMTPEEEFQREMSDACAFIIRLKKCGLNIILPGDEQECQRRFEALVNSLAVDSGFPADRPEWLTEEMVQRDARSVGARIYSMQQHLMEQPIVEQMQAILNNLHPRQEVEVEFMPEQEKQPQGLSRLFRRWRS